MLAASVDASKRFLVQQYTEFVALGYTGHYIHQQRVVVNSKVQFFEDGSTLELSRSHFIVTGAEWNTEPVGFIFKIPHESINPFRNGAKIMVFQLLSFGRRVTEHGSSCHDQIRAGIGQALINHKILLFPSKGCSNLAYVLVKVVAYINGCLVQGVN